MAPILTPIMALIKLTINSKKLVHLLCTWKPNKDNSFDTKTVVLFLCLKWLNRAVCRLCVCQGYACNLAFLNGKLPIISIFTVFCIPLTRKQGKWTIRWIYRFVNTYSESFLQYRLRQKNHLAKFRRGCLLLICRFLYGYFWAVFKAKLYCSVCVYVRTL